ncbi:MAG: hypothetical protein KDJ54_14985, partial [Candidatus Competibacteraceae bacterium]|nr:hypothetical protein [Candidatus Competibacteraceae bacterium]
MPDPCFTGTLTVPAAFCGPLAPPDRLATALALAVLTGNRCGHDPAAPRWFEPPPQHAARPKILLQLQERVRAYFDD